MLGVRSVRSGRYTRAEIARFVEWHPAPHFVHGAGISAAPVREVLCVRCMREDRRRCDLRLECVFSINRQERLIGPSSLPNQIWPRLTSGFAKRNNRPPP